MAAPTETAEDVEPVAGGFDSLGPVVRATVVGSGRTVHYIDEGHRDWQPMLFFGGAGTTARAFGLLEFARRLREQLRIRVISIERNGLGQTRFDPAVGFDEHTRDVWSLLDGLGVGRLSVVAISGGGPYAARVAAAQPGRVRSIHLACAFSERLDERGLEFSAEHVAEDPAAWWRFPEASPVRRIPGFDDSVIEEATRGRFARGRDTPPDGLRQAFTLYRDARLPDLSRVTAPAFLYWGSEDTLVPTAHLDRWRRALPSLSTVRLYDGEAHDVQYRHWDQILTDVAHLGERTVVSFGGSTFLARADRSSQLLDAGGTLGLAAWQEIARR